MTMPDNEICTCGHWSCEISRLTRELAAMTARAEVAEAEVARYENESGALPENCSIADAMQAWRNCEARLERALDALARVNEITNREWTEGVTAADTIQLGEICQPVLRENGRIE
jgi:hypothetical protein